jgi:hypothetical protein
VQQCAAELHVTVPFLLVLVLLLLLQRATIAVHDGKILVKTEIVKAIITADKAILIKGRWDAKCMTQMHSAAQLSDTSTKQLYGMSNEIWRR